MVQSVGEGGVDSTGIVRGLPDKGLLGGRGIHIIRRTVMLTSIIALSVHVCKYKIAF